MENEKPIAMVWLRNDLRLSDQQSFSSAVSSGLDVVAYYCFDPKHYETTQWGFPKTESYRAQFLIETLTQLKQALLELNISLIVEHKDPVEGLVHWIDKLNVSTVYFQKEWTQEERVVEKKLRSIVRSEIVFK